MKKILSGIMGIAMIVAVVSGAAYAAFSSQATVSNVSFATGNATLLVWDGAEYAENWTSNLSFGNMYPGYQSSASPIWLKNTSTSPISLAVTMQLTDGGVNWPNALTDAVEIIVYDSTNSTSNAGGWKSLNDWNVNPDTFPGAALLPETDRMFNVYVRVPSSFGNEIANLGLPLVGFTLTGTQI